MTLILPTKFTMGLDGPAAAGAGTLTKKICQELGMFHVSAGGLYREHALRVRDAGLIMDENTDIQDPEIIDFVCDQAHKLDGYTYEDTEIYADSTGLLARFTAKIGLVREIVRKRQYAFTTEHDRLFMEGRDIGSVVMPNADILIFLTAFAEVRADRRHKQAINRGEETNFESVLADINARDKDDRNRDVSPLVKVDRAFQINNSHMDADETFAYAMDIIERHLSSRIAA